MQTNPMCQAGLPGPSRWCGLDVCRWCYTTGTDLMVTESLYVVRNANKLLGVCCESVCSSTGPDNIGSSKQTARFLPNGYSLLFYNDSLVTW